MVTQIEAGAAGSGCAPHQGDDGDSTDPAVLAATLVAVLEQALLAAHRLLCALETSNGHRAGLTGPELTAPGVGAGGLSRREREVLRLLAAGHSNRRIAHSLFLSPRTVQRHVANIYLKIGAHCRTEATSYAIGVGLA